jgi:glutathione synthase/RimK-type ligase-like ATP-grasp enzyme
MSKTVLIIGQSPDAHIDAVSAHLRSMGATPVLFDISRHSIELSVRNGVVSGYVTCDSDNKKVPFESIHSVWDRFKQWCDHTIGDEAVRSEVRFAWSEWMDTLASLSEYVAPDRWINPYSQRVVSCKAVQHVLASEIGFRVPDTSVTNDADAVLKLFERHERVIYKPNSGLDLTDGRIVFTTEVDQESIRASVREIQVAPGIFQHLVEKDHELRVTVVGSQLFPVRINSQNSDSTQVDWRRDVLREEMYEVATLDESLSERILEFHRRSKLVYGAYDLIITHGGEAVFLEVNPAGQWMHYEMLFGLPISREMAVRLVES